jgi:predicted nucleic acid-binding protein
VILVDTSVWIDHFRDSVTPAVRRLRDELKDGTVIVGDLVEMEILQGLRHARDIERVRGAIRHLPSRMLVTRGIATQAAANYRILRARGFTIRSSIDVLIATYCIARDLPLLHSDRDFEPFAAHLGLRTVPTP